MSTISIDQPVTLVPVVLPTGGREPQAVESACLALRLVSDYAAATGVSRSASVRELLVNVVADLVHLSDLSGVSFEAVVGEAQRIVAEDTRHDELDRTYADV